MLNIISHCYLFNCFQNWKLQ